MQQNLLSCVNYRVPFHTKSLTKLNIFRSFRNRKGMEDTFTRRTNRVRKPRTRTSACIKNLLTCKILTMVMPNVRLFVFLRVCAVFKEKIHPQTLPSIFSAVLWPPSQVFTRDRDSSITQGPGCEVGRGRGNWVEVRHQGQDRPPDEAVSR